MTTFTERRHAAEFVLSEANGQRSRENVIIAGGTANDVFEAGSVIGRKADGKWTLAPAGTENEEVARGVLLYRTDASAGDVEAAIIRRDAEINGKLVTYHSSVDDAAKLATKAAQLEVEGIILR